VIGFLDFKIESELIPLIIKVIAPTDFTNIGRHSIAVCYCFNSFSLGAQLFSSHFALSPAVWWGGRENTASD